MFYGVFLVVKAAHSEQKTCSDWEDRHRRRALPFVYFPRLLLYKIKQKAEEQLVINNARMKQNNFIKAVTADNVLK